MSLIAYARDADRYPAGPSPLPPQTARRVIREHGFLTPTSWPVDLLPAQLIAADLLARGVIFRRGLGYSEHGAALDADQVARLLADVLDEAADALPTDSVGDWNRYLDETLPAVEDSAHERISRGFVDGTLTDEAAGGWLNALVDSWRPIDDRMIESLPERAEIDARNRSDSFALRRTAEDLRSSQAARRRLLDAVRPHLAEQHAEVEQDDAAALAWLATFDCRATVRRSELAALYSEAASPGALPPARLRALAEDRWGAPTKVRGHFTHRPAQVRGGAAVLDLQARLSTCP